MSDLAEVARYRWRHEADLARGILEAEGIESAVLADDVGGVYPGIAPARLVVSRHDLERARTLLRDAETAGGAPLDGSSSGPDSPARRVGDAAHGRSFVAGLGVALAGGLLMLVDALESNHPDVLGSLSFVGIVLLVGGTFLAIHSARG